MFENVPECQIKRRENSQMRFQGLLAFKGQFKIKF